MRRDSIFLTAAFAMLPIAAAHAQAKPDAAAETAACKQETSRNGVGKATGAAVCTIKRIFQSRIRLRPDADPIEMTVGSPPMMSEDSETPGAGNWEFNVALALEHGSHGHELEFPVADINYGLGDRMQLTYSVPYVSLREPDDTPGSNSMHSAHGVGDSEFGFKYRFYDNEARGISMALNPQLRVRTPGAPESVSEGGHDWKLPVTLVSEFEHFSLTANLGMEFEDGERSSFASFGAGRRLTDRLAVMAELYGHHFGGEGRHVLANFGVRQKLGHGQVISAALGRDLDVGDGEPRLTYFTLNYQKLIGE